MGVDKPKIFHCARLWIEIFSNPLILSVIEAGVTTLQKKRLDIHVP